MKRQRVGIVIFPEVEVLDFCGPYEVFTVTRLDEAQRREEPSPFEVLLLGGAGGGDHHRRGDAGCSPDCALAACPPLDILVVPGGWGTRRQIDNKILIDWIAEQGRQVDTLTSVCTGALLLGQAGLRARSTRPAWRHNNSKARSPLASSRTNRFCSNSLPGWRRALTLPKTMWP